jgi:hypothetical protein
MTYGKGWWVLKVCCDYTFLAVGWEWWEANCIISFLERWLSDGHLLDIYNIKSELHHPVWNVSCGKSCAVLPVTALIGLLGEPTVTVMGCYHTRRPMHYDHDWSIVHSAIWVPIIPDSSTDLSGSNHQRHLVAKQEKLGTKLSWILPMKLSLSYCAALTCHEIFSSLLYLHPS